MCVKDDESPRNMMEDAKKQQHNMMKRPSRIEKILAEDDPLEAMFNLGLRPADGRTIFFSRHGESEYNIEERIGGDPRLTPRGARYAKALGLYMNNLGEFFRFQNGGMISEFRF